jgi:hypothetical protein
MATKFHATVIQNTNRVDKETNTPNYPMEINALPARSLMSDNSLNGDMNHSFRREKGHLQTRLCQPTKGKEKSNVAKRKKNLRKRMRLTATTKKSRKSPMPSRKPTTRKDTSNTFQIACKNQLKEVENEKTSKTNTSSISKPSPIGLHNYSDVNTWLCTLCKLPDPPQDVSKKINDSKSDEKEVCSLPNEIELEYCKGEEVFTLDADWIYQAKVIDIHSDKANKIWFNIEYEHYPEDNKCVTSDRLLKINDLTMHTKMRLDFLIPNGCSAANLSNCPEQSVDYASVDIGQKVIVYYKGQLYEGVIKDFKRNKTSNENERNIHYLVHYSCWNKKWDEWVSAQRIFEASQPNQELMKKMQTFKNATNGTSSTMKASSSIGMHHQCRKKELPMETEFLKKTDWTSCQTCKRWYHNLCTGLKNMKDFSCPKSSCIKKNVSK